MSFLHGNPILSTQVYIMISCFESYLRTTDPTVDYSTLVDIHVGFSIVFHTLVYFLLFTITTRFFFGRTKSLSYLPVVLIVVMVLGYIGRLYRSKTIYQGFLDRNYNESEALKETRDYMKTAYFTFYFMG